MSKIAARRAAMQLVYENMYGGQGGDDTLFGMVDYQVENDDEVSYIYDLVTGAVRHAEETDKIIGEYSPQRELERIPGISRAVLRLALYELKYCMDTPESVIINEAVEMAKRFSLPDDRRFINGLLGAYVRDNPRP